MKETERIAKLFKDLYNGSPWIAANFTDTLENITAEQATKRISPGRNTIWEIVNHIVNWRLNVLRRIQGETITTPEDNYILPIEDTSEIAWKETLGQLNDSQEKWLDFFKIFEENDFSKIYPNNHMTYYEHIHGILQHDAYHLGQIVLLAKTV